MPELVLLNAPLEELEHPEVVGIAVLLLRLLLGSDPAFRRHVGGTGGFGFAEALAFVLVMHFVATPDGLEAAAVADPGLVGAEEFAIEVSEGLGDGPVVFDGLGLDTRRAGNGHGRDLAGVEDLAGAPRIEGFGEESVSDLGGDELNGGEIFEERHGDFAALLRADGIAVAMADAEAFAAHGALVAHASVDGEGAAAPEFGFGHVGSSS